ncbi:MAG: signal recognition particle-docking protein FtsY [Holosporales bacterium]|jgi:fused signal recognition particle receptor|nr:signal recognition particle-docking protein FtsY [Holosporales bacterium]
MSFFKKLKDAILLKGIRSSEDHSSVSDLEDILIEADFGFNLASKLAREVTKKGDALENLGNELRSILSPLVVDFEVSEGHKPFVVFVVGVNGCGKTTTIAKLMHFLMTGGKRVAVAACDTFRVAATEQLSFWAKEIGCDIYIAKDGQKDPASLAFEAMKASYADILIIDTAGRLQNNANLMDELSKMYRVVSKIDQSAPHMNLMILDATTGQNAMEQVLSFSKVHPITGLIISKMDGHAKGGMIVRIADELKIPILGVGIGESMSDFAKFSIDKFLEGLME